MPAQHGLGRRGGSVVGRRPPKTNAAIGTPKGFSHAGSMEGHWEAGAVKRPFGCAAGLPEAGVQGSPRQSSMVRFGSVTMGG